jgi:outer membrane receptor protein involved in Fe transport
VVYNHRCGFFAGSDLTWYAQDNRERSFVADDPANNPTVGRLRSHDLPDDEFPQWNLALGWRFPRQRGDVTFGVLNLTDENYHLSPVNFYNEMPHERVFYGRVRVRF